MVSTESAKLAYSLHCGRRKDLWTWVARDRHGGRSAATGAGGGLPCGIRGSILLTSPTGYSPTRGGIGGMGGRGLLSGQQTLGGLGDGVCQGPGDRAVSLPAPCSVTTLAQGGRSIASPGKALCVDTARPMRALLCGMIPMPGLHACRRKQRTVGCRAKQTALLFLKKAEWSRHNKGCISGGKYRHQPATSSS